VWDAGVRHRRCALPNATAVHLDLFRIDFNIPSPTPFEGEPIERHGLMECNFWRYWEGFCGVFERARAKYPELVLQQAACGGRNDLMTVGRFHEAYLTDGLRMPYELQNYSGQALSLPPENFLIAPWSRCRWGDRVR